MQESKRGYKKPEQGDLLTNSVVDISDSFDLIDGDFDKLESKIAQSFQKRTEDMNKLKYELKERQDESVANLGNLLLFGLEREQKIKIGVEI